MRIQYSATRARAGATLRLLSRGARETLPLLPGVVPFGLVYGIAARAAHISPSLTQAMSVIIFAGSAQFAVVTLVAAGTPALILVVTAAILNLRHLLYSVSLAPTLRATPRRWRLVVAYLLTDETYGTVIGRAGAYQPLERAAYVIGSGLCLWSSWQLSTLAGVLAGAQIPDSWSLDFAAPLTFIALLVPLLADRSAVWAAAVAAVAAGVSFGAPLKLGIVIAACAGMAAGLVADALAHRLRPSIPVDQTAATTEER